ncbi:MAG: CvpA family protein [Pseudomonadota bacterium]
MYWLDTVIIVIIVISIIIGIKRGLVKEAFSLLSLILGIFIASRSYMEGAKIIDKLIHHPNIAKIISFIAIFLLVAVLLSIISILIKKLIKFVQLGWIDRLGGLAFGFVRGGIIIGVLLILITKYPVLGSDKWVKGSLTAPFFLHFIESLRKLIQ